MGFAQPWFWWPLIGSGLTAAVFGYAAYHYNRRYTYPRVAVAAGFKGMVRDTAKFTLVGSGAGLVASIVAKDLAKFGSFQQAMLAVLLLSIFAAILNYWMASALDTRMDADEKSETLTTPLWEVIHGTVFGLSLGAMGTILAAIIAFAASF